MEKIISHGAKEDNMLDTYANLLYKLGQTEEAIQWEEKAVSSWKGWDDQNNSFIKVLEEMKKGEPTYLEEGAIWIRKNSSKTLLKMRCHKLFLTIQWLSCIASAQVKINQIGYNKSALPIKSERTISITTNEGSYLDVDISPDGSTILFSCLGELFSLPANGGVATQLTRGLAINRCPLWSPDGKKIAYESDASGFIGLHVTNLSGSYRKVLAKAPYTDSRKIMWFPDSKNIAVNWNVYHLTGAASYLPDFVKRILGGSSDGRFIYFQENISSDSSAIVKYDRSNQEKTKLLILTNQNYHNTRISPDGCWITYIKYGIISTDWPQKTPADSLMAIEMKSGKEKLLAHLNIKFTTEYLDKQHYSFSKDSKYLYIGYGGKIHRIEIESGKNEIIPFTADVKVDLGAMVYHKYKVSLDSLDVRYIRSVSRSPDGKHLVFSCIEQNLCPGSSEWQPSYFS
jgi:hypothetical protein